MTTKKQKKNRTAVKLNAERVTDAEQALVAYANVKEHNQTDYLDRTSQDREDWLVDILADLRHWARSNKLDFDDCVRMATNHFEAEVGEELEPAEGGGK
jgi:hypothetical protein